jgi:hypothetical protein
MRTVKKLSPTSLHLWEGYRDEFYVKYLSDAPKPREPQTQAMTIGSAFDAFVKCSLHGHLFGHDGDGEYDLKTLFETQCQVAELRPWAWEAGKYAFDCYRTWGCYDELLRELQQSEEDPQFEFELRGEVEGVPLVGKPDLWYRRQVQVIYDWKVMGFCSRHAQSPKKFYKTCRDCWGKDRAKPTRGFKGEPVAHKGYKEIDHYGHKIGDHFLEAVDKKWADQITIYTWMSGVPVGDEDTVVGLDQLACKPSPDPEKNRHPLIRVAQHRCRISAAYQRGLVKRLQACWDQIQSGHIFDDLTREESEQRCAMLDMQLHSEGAKIDSGAMKDSAEMDAFWADVNKKEFRG